MANYYMHEWSVDCNLGIDLLNLDFSNMFDNMIEEIYEAIRGVDFVLNKYSWDNKKAYEPSQQSIIDQARIDKTTLLLNIRRINKIKNNLVK